MKLTTEHPMSSYNQPVFVDEDNNAMNFNTGVKELRKMFGWSTRDLAEKLGVSHRTVEGWEMDRIPNNQALATMKLILEHHNANTH